MKSLLKSALAAFALMILAQAPAQSAVVYSFNNALSCSALSGGCSIATDSNLLEPSQGYSSLAGFDSQFARGTSITAQLWGMPTHTSVSIDFLLAVIDSWDGLTGAAAGPDVFEVKVDGVTVFSAGYDIFNAGDQSPILGTQLAYNVQLGFSGWNDAAYDMASVAALHGIAHSAANMTVQFLFANSQGLSDESFAIENLRISVPSNGVPEPSILALLALGLAGIGFSRRRRA